MMFFWASATLFVVVLAIGGVTAELLEDKVSALESRKVPIHYEVVKSVGTWSKKHLVLYTKEGGTRQNLEELLPLDVSAFIKQGLAKKGDQLTTTFDQQDESRFLTARIRHSTAPSEPHEYIIRIHQAGGIGFVRLSEARNTEEGSMVAPEEEKLYYVRVPFNLFTRLDGEALQDKTGSRFSGYTLTDKCVSPHWPTPKIGPHKGSTPRCLVLWQAENPISWLAIHLEAAQSAGSEGVANDVGRTEYYFITAKEVAHIKPPNPSLPPSLFEADPKLASHSHVQYVVMVPLLPSTQFNRMEPKYVEKHGQLVADQEQARKCLEVGHTAWKNCSNPIFTKLFDQREKYTLKAYVSKQKEVAKKCLEVERPATQKCLEEPISLGVNQQKLPRKPDGLMDLVFEKNGLLRIVDFPITGNGWGLHSQWGHSLQTIEKEEHPNGMGVSYYYELNSLV